jgi:hypothetical protein
MLEKQERDERKDNEDAYEKLKGSKIKYDQEFQL